MTLLLLLPQASNILLQASDNNACNITAKVADFGLSMKMDAADTHISNSYSGTLPYMAPELLKNGVRSKAADV
jgi:serine/threonine protein kinase